MACQLEVNVLHTTLTQLASGHISQRRYNTLHGHNRAENRYKYAGWWVNVCVSTYIAYVEYSFIFDDNNIM